MLSQIQGEGKEEQPVEKQRGSITVGLMNLKLMSWNETKIQSMTDGVVKSLGVGRFLDWRTLEAAEQLEGCCRVFTGVYGPFNKKDRECLWDELGAVRGLWGDPWCVGGDFNVILAQGERSRQGRVTPAMRRFAQVMDDLELIDLPFKGALSRGVGGFIIKPGPG
ncbi:hypothetical protein CK203_023201 [Vitis vinifera]|uniref:Endonuclease/exonuclease/phosphatase domain-containing protein n=1 Tax=Vitis vinifera TaxID=29760 RepID=A0A438J1Z9_VITVI|nr:hypothetical protein CK203_023201 [Vitis vinifera]